MADCAPGRGDASRQPLGVKMTRHIRIIVAAVAALMCAGPALADGVRPFPAVFRVQDVAANGAPIHVRSGGSGPTVVLIHGFGDSGDMWSPLAARLVKNHRVVVPDLRGMGLSSHPETGYDKKNEGRDIAAILSALKIGGAVVLCTQDIRNLVCYAFRTQNLGQGTLWVVIFGPLPVLWHWITVMV